MRPSCFGSVVEMLADAQSTVLEALIKALRLHAKSLAHSQAYPVVSRRWCQVAD